MANPQAQTNGEQKTKAAKASKEKKQRREPSLLTWWWRFFWMRRSGARTVWALILAIPTLLMIVYIALSASDQTQVVAAIQAAAQIVGQTLGPTGLRVGLEITMVVFALASMALLLAPGYRQYRYLHLPTSVIPRCTVLLDFENMASNDQGELLLKLMLERLKKEVLSYHDFTQRRVDLLYFMNARHLTKGKIPESVEKDKRAKWIATSNRLNDGYNELYLNGFQFVNSPHKIIPRQDDMKEAVDRSIELFAFERALLGGFKQEFIIISGDGDYAPLIYRLVALGHTVQVWMWGETKVYKEVEKRISLKVVPLLETKQDQASQESAHSHQQADNAKTSDIDTAGLSLEQASPATLSNVASIPQDPPEVTFSEPGMDALYKAIYHTVAKYRSLESHEANAQTLFDKLTSYLDTNKRRSQELLAVGYSGPSSRGAWIRGITAVGVFRGTAPDQAARQFFYLALASAHALMQTPENLEKIITIEKVLVTLNASEFASARLRNALGAICANNKYKAVNVRFLLYCARALGIITFTSAPATPDLISNPRLTALGEQLIAQFSADSQPDAPGATE